MTADGLAAIGLELIKTERKNIEKKLNFKILNCLQKI